jgi:hypothetical protein
LRALAQAERPFNVLLRNPEMGNASQKLGDYLRSYGRPSTPERDGDLMTARWWSAQCGGRPTKGGVDRGLNPSVIDDIQAVGVQA